jgi:hypothetical protein
MLSTTQPYTTEELCLHGVQQVGYQHNHQKQAVQKRQKELRHCWQTNPNLPFLNNTSQSDQNQTNPSKTNDQRPTHSHHGTHHHLQHHSQHNDIPTFNDSSSSCKDFDYVGRTSALCSQILNDSKFQHTVFDYDGRTSALYANKTSRYSSNYML